MPATERALCGDPTTALSFAYGGPVLKGRLRVEAEDFVVEEQLGYSASGDGEHDFLIVQKRDRNTHDVARTLARLAGVPQVAVGYAGLKDRLALTTQHFTVQLPGRGSPDWASLNDDSLQVLDVQRHHRKIRRGSLRGNRFVITARDVRGDREVAESRLQQIRARGVPNYFGGQRFGHAGRNLQQVDALFAGQGRRPKRELRGLLLSAARAHLFNLVLAARVDGNSWNAAMPGEVISLAGSQGQFVNDPNDASIATRLDQGVIHPTGPLCGRASRSLQPDGDVHCIETDVLRPWADWIDGLQRFGVDADRRALRLLAEDLDWQWRENTLRLTFALPAGAYATAAVRELLTEPPP